MRPFETIFLALTHDKCYRQTGKNPSFSQIWVDINFLRITDKCWSQCNKRDVYKKYILHKCQKKLRAMEKYLVTGLEFIATKSNIVYHRHGNLPRCEPIWNWIVK